MLTKTQAFAKKTEARIAVCLYVRNAENDIQEWIAYHYLIGINSFVLYDNGSDDQTVKKARELSSIINLHVVSWAHATGLRAQGEAYLDCLERFQGEFNWLLYIDSDEFLVNSNNDSIHALAERHSDAAAIAFNWACFGSNGHSNRPTGLIIENFVCRATDDFGPNAHTKMLLRPNKVIDYVNPHFFTMDGAVVRVSGQPVDWRIQGVTHTVDLTNWRVNHYFVRSKAQWAEKVRRGYRDVTTRKEDEFYFYDRNEVKDYAVAIRGVDVRRWLADAGVRLAE